MSNAIRVLVVASICSTIVAKNTPHETSVHQEACQRYASAVVRIDTGRGTGGTGFIVSPDGWVFTAAHVVVNPRTGKPDETITVTLSDGSIKFATEVLPVEPNMVGRDFALLKIGEAIPKLPYIELGDESIDLKDTVVGSDVTIIGFPFSAIGFHSTAPSIKEKFCLSGSIAYSGQADVGVMVNTPKGSSTVKVNVDVVYFQGPSVKGLSGSPIVSNDTGHVIAILTSKLTGISESLAVTRGAIADETHPGISIGPVDVGKTTADLIDTLDGQLANGLGAGTGIEDAKAAMRHILRQRHTQQK